MRKTGLFYLVLLTLSLLQSRAQSRSLFQWRNNFQMELGLGEIHRPYSLNRDVVNYEPAFNYSICWSKEKAFKAHWHHLAGFGYRYNSFASEWTKDYNWAYGGATNLEQKIEGFNHSLTFTYDLIYLFSYKPNSAYLSAGGDLFIPLINRQNILQRGEEGSVIQLSTLNETNLLNIPLNLGTGYRLAINENWQLDLGINIQYRLAIFEDLWAGNSPFTYQFKLALVNFPSYHRSKALN